ncbi:DUF2798 domain-containing protein [Nitrosomonas supralitoralis]|uniref:DUF2798 domain-containing protein n=1 Tax=Nitrosomonas supralitoralis TaxID=2116706 RepID=A0A2P7NXQ5_9PROT|nr:DUF2798 domain-containing protein [Nitrosomonas supralitoralis]PSJ18241.1 DUF2798 domain-containing protein [Nitrosomonas supralitoralis]
MKQKLLAHCIYCLIMSATMTGCVSAIVTAVNLGFSDAIIEPWLYSWSIAFPVGFVLLLFVSPYFKRIIEVFIHNR